MQSELKWSWVSTLLTLVLVGCAASDEGAAPSAFPESPQVETHRAERLVPAETVTALQACLTEGVSRLSRHAYELSFEVQTTPRDTERWIEIEHGRLDDTEVEACMVRALQVMPLMGLVALDETLALSTSPQSPSARPLLGTATVLPELIHLAPIVLTGSGVTIVVSVGVLVLATLAAAQMSKECQEEWNTAMKQCLKHLESNQPPYGVTGGYVNTKDCARGLVSQRCGGNRYDGDGQPARPGRRT